MRVANRWISTVLAVIVAFIALDSLLLLLDANPDNVVVAFVGAVAGLFLAPFATMFGENRELLTALVAIIGWSLLAGLLVAVLRTAVPEERVVEREVHHHDAGEQRDRSVEEPVDRS